MPEENVYICKLGHRTDRPGLCPKDRSRVEPARYVCDYCDYAARGPGRAGRCPNCDAPLRSLIDRKPDKAA